VPPSRSSSTESRNCENDPAGDPGLAPEALAGAYTAPYNGAAISTQQFLLHLLSHLNYDLGQIDYLRRITSDAGAIELATL